VINYRPDRFIAQLIQFRMVQRRLITVNIHEGYYFFVHTV